MGSLKSLLGMMPDFKNNAGQQIDDKPMKKFKSILFSMTIKEKLDQHLINGFRKRIAKGSGTEVSDSIKCFKQFESMRKIHVVWRRKKNPTSKISRSFFYNLALPFS